jgi:N-carbamoyl-L-amino-acid hydrolase
MSHSAGARRFSADRRRLAEVMEWLATFGRFGETGVGRLAYAREDREATEYVRSLMEEIGLATRYDPVGNLFGRRPGEHPEPAPAVMSGSHLDGPPWGGRYDGTVGVVCALEAIRLLEAGGVRTRSPVEAAVIACEHLDRFGLSCLGSRALSGKLATGELRRLRDADGHSLWDVLAEQGYAPDRLAEAIVGPRQVRAFVEVHVEQGRVLEDQGKRIGIVTAIPGPTRMRVRLRGMADHSGGTPMAIRRDALTGAAELVLQVEALARREGVHGTVGTVGVLNVHPGAVHTIPGEVDFAVDIRGVDLASKRRVVDEFRQALDRVGAARGLGLEVSTSVDEAPVPCSPWIVERIAAACARLGIDALRLSSGGGHDAQHLAAVTESGMIFVPSARGIAHTPEEYTELEDIALGAEVLAEVLASLAEEVPAG